jgi:hypothetical protein
LNSFVLHVIQELAKGYNAQTIHKLATEIEDEIEQEEMLQTESPTGRCTNLKYHNGDLSMTSK